MAMQVKSDGGRSAHSRWLETEIKAYLTRPTTDSNHWYMLTVISLHILGIVLEKVRAKVPRRTAKLGEFLKLMDAVTAGGKHDIDVAGLGAHFTEDHMVACTFFVGYTLAHGLEAMDAPAANGATPLGDLLRVPMRFEVEGRKAMFMEHAAKAERLLEEFQRPTTPQNIYLAAVRLHESLF